MEIETRNQLLGVIAGTVIALGVSQIPGLEGGKRFWVIGACAVISSYVVKAISKRVKGGIPGFR